MEDHISEVMFGYKGVAQGWYAKCSCGYIGMVCMFDVQAVNDAKFHADSFGGIFVE